MKIGFIGSGHMATAMAHGWARSDFDGSMLFTDGGSGRAETLAGVVGGEVAPDNGHLATEADLVVLAIKPAQLVTVAVGLTQPGTPVLSLLGATSLGTLTEALPGIPVARVMPNLPVSIGAGVLCYSRADNVPEEVDNRNMQLLEMLGDLYVVDDEVMDVATAIMGCSPAYVALFAEALAREGAERGLDPILAREMVAETIAGTARLLDAESAARIQSKVASPGGSTEKGLEALHETGFVDSIYAAVNASMKRMGHS